MWMPDLETAAAGVATAVWGDAVPILMGLSAARIHGALPRALGEAMVAVPSIHGPISLTDRNATIRFITRNVEALDAIRVGTELGPALATTPAQTALDLARDPRLLEKPEDIAVVRALLDQTTVDEIADVAATQGRTNAALARVQKVVES